MEVTWKTVTGRGEDTVWQLFSLAGRGYVHRPEVGDCYLTEPMRWFDQDQAGQMADAVRLASVVSRRLLGDLSL